MVLPARPCVPFVQPPEELGEWRAAMSTRQRRTSARLEVAVVYEPNRLAADHLANAYTQVVPVVSRRSKTAAQSVPALILRRTKP